jgi:hypothetical protein
MGMRRCKLCGKEEEDFLGPYCLQCDKLVADIYADLATGL